MKKLKVLDLFSGIGGFSLGLERTGGFETVAFCEIEEFPRKVLRKHWPNVPIYEDVKELTAAKLTADGIAVDVITGGFPCQDISVAGKQRGLVGTRSGLWSDLHRLIGELRPRFAVVENVANLLSGPSEKRGGWFGRVLGDLAEVGYDAEWHCISAAGVGAPHIRDRIWVVAYPRQIARSGSKNWTARYGEQGFVFREWDKKKQDGNFTSLGSTDTRDWRLSSNCDEERKLQPQGLFQDIRKRIGNSDWWESEPNVGRVAYGVPGAVDRVAGLGNAVVPQIPELIGHAILETELTIEEEQP